MSMIRLPPTSISLSDSDIQIHLREINIYQSLLERGFKRQDIQTYYASTRFQVGPQSSQHQPIERTHRASSDEKESITPGQDSAGTRMPEWYEVCPQERERARIDINPSQGLRVPKVATQPAGPLAQESWNEGVDCTQQPSSNEACGEAGRAGSEIVETIRSSDTKSYAPNTVDLLTRTRISSKCLPVYRREPQDDHGDLSSQTVEDHRRLQEKGNNIDIAADSHSLPVARSLHLPSRHGRRQTSLLHITRNAASPSSSAYSDDSFKSTVTKMPQAHSHEFERSPRARTMTYRPRSQTYPWAESEADDPSESVDNNPAVEESSSFQQAKRKFRATPPVSPQIATNKIESSPPEVCPISVTRIEPSPAGSTVITSHHQVSSSTSLRAEAEDFVPLRLPPPFSATRRVSLGQSSLPSSIHITSPSRLHHDAHPRSSPNLAASTPGQSSSTGSVTRQLGSCFSSPPPKTFPSSPPKSRDREQSPLLGPSIPVTNTPRNRGGQVFREISPRAPPKTPRTQVRIQQTDGPGMVYDDRVPAHLQPRTPADLTRGLYVTGREAAYTSPPGRTARKPATISEAIMSPYRPVGPEESPSRRARTMRERRERELRRAVVVEDAMWSRFREMEGNVVELRTPLYGPGPSLLAGWRDDFDADRVGEENFDVEGRLEPRLQSIVRARNRHQG